MATVTSKMGMKKCFMCSNVTKIAPEEFWIIILLSGISYEVLFEKSSLTSGLPNLLIMPISPPILELWKWFFDTIYAVIDGLKYCKVRFEKNRKILLLNLLVTIVSVLTQMKNHNLFCCSFCMYLLGYWSKIYYIDMLV